MNVPILWANLLKLSVKKKKAKIKADIIKCIPGNKPNTFLSVLISFQADEEITNFINSWQGTI